MLIISALILLSYALQTHAAEPSKAGVALVIGNSHYNSNGQLANPVNDADLIADTLAKLHFDVIRLTDGTQAKMKAAILAFGDELEKRGKDTVGVFYYAGHGAQTDGRNFLIPVDASIKRGKDLYITAVDASIIVESMKAAGNRLNFIILDACRNFPFADDKRSALRGLARLEAAQGTLIAYSTAPGDVAFDGDGRNSPYALALADEMRLPNIAVERMFRQVRNRVMEATGQRQIPWENSSLTGDDYFFNPAPATAESPKLPPLPPVSNAPAKDTSDNLSLYLDFLTRPAQSDTFRTFTDTDTLTSGDLYKIMIRPEADGYLYIFQVDASGAIQRLFPMAEYNGLRLNNINPVRRGTTYFLPAANKAFQLDDNHGKDAIYVFASRLPRPDIEELSSQLAKAQASENAAASKAAEARLYALFKSRDLPLEPAHGQSGAPKYSFSQDGGSFESVAGYLKNICADCVHVLEFNHR